MVIFMVFTKITGNFDNFKNITEQYVNEIFNQSTTVQETISSKNLFNTLIPRERLSLNAVDAFNIKNVKHLEFGSSSFYLKEMRQAVTELLQEKTLTPEERALLEKWLKTTESTQQITWIYDYLRVRIPFVLPNILAGQNPCDSLVVRCLAPFYSPSSDQLELLSSFIIERVNELEPEGSFAIPAGSLFHETIILIERDKAGEFKLSSYDPNSRYIKESSITDPNLLKDLSFWKNMCKSKFQKDFSSDFKSQTWKVRQEISYEFSLRIQSGNYCFAHSHWGFFRFFILKHFSHDLSQGFILSKALEIRIKEKIIEKTASQDKGLYELSSQCIVKKKLKQILRSNQLDIETLKKLTLEILNRLEKNQKMMQINNNIVKITDQIDELNALPNKKSDSYHQDIKTILKIAKWAFSNLEEKEQTIESQSESNLLPVFFNFLAKWCEFEKKLEMAYFKRTLRTLERIEGGHGLFSLILSLFNKIMRNLTLESYLNNVSYNDYFELFFKLNRFLFLQPSLQEVRNQSKRLLQVITRSSSQILKNMAFVNIEIYFNKENQFSSNNPEWTSVKDEIMSQIPQNSALKLLKLALPEN